MLAYEKETLGYYLTSHPLKEHRELVEKLSSATTAVLEQKVRQEVSICGVLLRGKRVKTRKGDMMYRAQLEDWDGSAELVVFPKTYAECHALCADDRLVFVKGRVEADGDVYKILASEVHDLEDARTRTARRVVLHLPLQSLEDELIYKAEALVRNNMGEVPIRFHLEAPDGRALEVRAGRRLKVEASARLRSGFEEIFGEGTVEYQY
jgi:DNA polymerase-3 subunit alpha